MFVATTVIEVGVDVPNATVMVILDADRFGIAQLHQLRGRVGRGAHASTCWLVGEATTPDGDARLEALVARPTASNWPRSISICAVRARFSGNGRRAATISSWPRSDAIGTVVKARQVAIELVDADPALAHHPGLAAELDVFLDADDAEFLLKG